MSIISKIKHILHPIQGEIWCLHRVVAERSIFPSNRELEITPDYLESLIVKHQQSGYQFVSMDEIVDDIHRCPLDLRRKKRVNITFDDGFHDVYDNAFPILRRHHIPFTVYLVGNFSEGASDIWWIQLERYANGNVDWFEKTMKDIYQSGKNMRDVMHEKTESEPNMDLCRELALTWEQLKEMVDSGLCTIGAHSMTHPGLTRISEEEVRNELTESKRIIEEHLPIRVEHFSYPHSMEIPEIQAMLKETGYKTATMGYGGKVRKGDNLYKLNRRYIIQKTS